MKKIFDLYNYLHPYDGMNCQNSEEAKMFCEYLDACGRTWRTGQPYTEHRDVYERSGTVYFFNKGMIGRPVHAHDNGGVLLNFSDFDWGAPSYGYEQSNVTLDEILGLENKNDI